MDRGNFERDQIAHEAEDVWTPPTAFFAREDQEFDGLGHDQFKVLRVFVRIFRTSTQNISIPFEVLSSFRLGSFLLRAHFCES